MLGTAVDKHPDVDDKDAIRRVIERDGLVYLRGRCESDLVSIIEALGRPIYVEEVRVSSESRSLVRSAHAVPWHTDHHRAHRIVWYGRAPAEEGGETLVVDGLAAYGQLCPAHQASLRGVAFTEHRMFTHDREEYPMVTLRHGISHLYVSFWQAPRAMAAAERHALDAFRRAVSGLQPQRFLLRRGDILAIDNTRMLHARTAIGGRAQRHLRRYWLARGQTTAT